VLTWHELEQAAPEIASRGRELIDRFQFVLVGTLTKNGSPRVNPCEAYVIDGHLLLNMIPPSLKALDLLRDDRIYVHTPVAWRRFHVMKVVFRLVKLFSGPGTRSRMPPC
jgi:hypothetical protein